MADVGEQLRRGLLREISFCQPRRAVSHAAAHKRAHNKDMRQRLLAFALLSFAILAPLPAATPLFQGSFENSNSAWTTLRGEAAIDPAVLHDGQKSMRVAPDAAGRDAAVQSAPVALTIGKRYQLTGWIRTGNLTVRDLDRSPIATGAALAMASMPFDMHSESLGGTRDWTRVQLRFTATRAQDNILLTAGTGGAFEGKAWFSGVSIDEASTSGDWPARAAIATYGPAYRYPTGGWLYLHIEGQPYERGYQHGRLMANEIVQYMERCAAQLDSKGKDQSWDLARTTANALFLRGFDQEILEEMKGIAEGASDAGARWQGRRIDLDRHGCGQHHGRARPAERSACPSRPTAWKGCTWNRPNYLEQHRDASYQRPLQRLRRHRTRPLATAAWSSGTPPGGRSRWPSRPT